MVIECEKKMNNKKQLQILKNWRKNKGKPVLESHTPIVLYAEGPQLIR